MTLFRLTCDCGREYALAVTEPEECEESADDAGSVDASHPKEADHVPKPELEVDATPSYEDPTDPFWAPDASEENETRIHEADPIELRPPPTGRPSWRGKSAFGFAGGMRG